MPRKDGTGPFGGGGAGTGRGTGRGLGGGNRPGSGIGGYCICPNCGKQISHQRGIPCSSINCPDCGRQMLKG